MTMLLVGECGRNLGQSAGRYVGEESGGTTNELDVLRQRLKSIRKSYIIDFPDTFIA